MTDQINHPEHYAQSDIECIDAIKAALTPEEFRGYCKGNVIRHIWRERLKGQNESVAKAAWYANRLLEMSSEPLKTHLETISEDVICPGMPKAKKCDRKRFEASEDKPSWKDAPEWAMWLAQDADGEWCWCENKPSAVVWYWYPDGHFSSACESKPNPNWRNTLEARP